MVSIDGILQKFVELSRGDAVVPAIVRPVDQGEQLGCAVARLRRYGNLWGKRCEGHFLSYFRL